MQRRCKHCDKALPSWVLFSLAAFLVACPSLFQDAYGQSEPIHTTIRFGPGKPAVAIEPSLESGAIFFDVATPVGVIPVLIQPAGPDLTPTPPPPSEPRPFRPPSIFSAPLPTGSGARALGFSGTFTAIADDATAASWNPAGLTQLERPEVSFVYRNSWFHNQHTSSDPEIQVGGDDYHSHGLNYLTAALPFVMPGVGGNAVASLNYQEAYDFASAFSACFSSQGHQHVSQLNRSTFSETQIDHFIFEPEGIRSDVEITSTVTTRSSSHMRQNIRTELLVADVEFEQEGTIDAISPAFAFEVHPRLSVGLAVNFYQDNLLNSDGIRSTSRSWFQAKSTSTSEIKNYRSTTVEYTATEITTDPEFGEFPPVTTNGAFSEIIQEDTVQQTDVRVVEGEIVERNVYEDLHGINATLGLWWVVTDVLTLGVSVDLPWDAQTEQTRVVESTATTYDESLTRVLGTSESTETSHQDVEFEFPLFATAGASFMWRPNLYSAIDVGFVDWSSFAYDIKGEGRINPFDGTPYGQNRVDDTWSIRMGTEYLMELNRQQIQVPVRFGLAWQQRPASGEPDDYFGFSLGTGLSIGDEGSKWIFDIAYSYLRAEDVQSIVPEEDALSTDTRQHQLYISLIKHF